MLLREKLGVLSCFPFVDHCTRIGVYDDILSQPLLPSWICVLFSQCVGATQLIFVFPSEEIVPYVAVNLVCPWEEVGSESSYIRILDWNPLMGFNIRLSSDYPWEGYKPLCLIS